MKKKEITFAELRELLLRLGFCETVQETDRIKFTHPTTGTILLFQLHDPKDIVTDREMLVVRRQLVDNGFMESLAFDHFLQKASA